MHLILALFPFLLAVPDIQLTIDRVRESVNVALIGKDELMDSCVKSGYTMRYNYENQICKKRFLWSDDCQSRRRAKHLLSYDPISSKYKLETDFLDDSEPVVVNYYDSAEIARDAISSFEGIPLDYIAHGDRSYFSENDIYLRSRVTSECLGAHSKTLGYISYYLTFGLYNISGFDTGWVDFDIKPIVPKEANSEKEEQ